MLLESASEDGQLTIGLEAPEGFLGLGVTLLSGWAWWRINKTNMTYVALLGEALEPVDQS